VYNLRKFFRKISRLIAAIVVTKRKKREKNMRVKTDVDDYNDDDSR
jgi:hypothetical protein